MLNYSDGLISELYSGSYSCMEVIDLNGDGQQELVSVVPDKATQTSMAVMFTKREGTFRKLSEMQLSGIAAEYVLSLIHISSEIRSMVKGLMIESYIEDGAQKVGDGVYGKSITDPCLGWEKSEKLVLEIADQLR